MTFDITAGSTLMYSVFALNQNLRTVFYMLPEF